MFCSACHEVNGGDGYILCTACALTEHASTPVESMLEEVTAQALSDLREFCERLREIRQYNHDNQDELDRASPWSLNRSHFESEASRRLLNLAEPLLESLTQEWVSLQEHAE